MLARTMLLPPLLSAMLSGIGLSSAAVAGVVIDGTRHIYPQQRREITLRLTNDDPRVPRLVQVWLDQGTPAQDPSHSDVPFSLAPPVFRLDPGKSQVVRLVYTQDPLPTDRESLFWLNALEIPPKVDAAPYGSQEHQSNHLQFAFRIRTKVFFRPAQLPGTADEAPTQLRWTLHRSAQGPLLEVHNPSAYHVTFNEVALAMGPQPDARLLPAEAGMVPPGGNLKLPVRDIVQAIPADAQVHFKYINDYGAFSVPQRAPLKY
ncbi:MULTISPECIES: fimbrial biogenesis chaperone [Pseudomonas]|uniref:Fimbria/pilus periplasmic chaperone n=1 Tax=Pseudomonas haemolytica TaxID=2600065 RepID=A0A5P1DEN7_9PSED|nr:MULTISPECIES: fimbria/pilus periplasmic chaperone [Pseudomonas]MBJ2246714.1 fimbria/pilus periplasmic chaperone [Pseudomonas haemolytica]MBJ2274710.1 fimbria/pilus periplasmic chaperone [Pseudomonas haemolytica]MBJ2283373.1 fimbria/pilus periplasmic chaperone [Pseudomonas sp. MF6755]MBK3449452.1 fimbria/pilus periplasmic chaperone [Pseudomonas haemolytica]MBK3457639.1 fimbria/pilus periplasmic chaperone [Pseudomonas haemolytica]